MVGELINFRGALTIVSSLNLFSVLRPQQRSFFTRGAVVSAETYRVKRSQVSGAMGLKWDVYVVISSQGLGPSQRL